MPATSCQNLCPICRKNKVLALQPGGKTPRSYRCLDCDGPDPLHSSAITKLLSAVHPPTESDTCRESSKPAGLTPRRKN